MEGNKDGKEISRDRIEINKMTADSNGIFDYERRGNMSKQLTEAERLKDLWMNAEIDSYTLNILHEGFINKYTYESTAIEGNTIDKLNQYFLIAEGWAIAGKKMKEHYEVLNHAMAAKHIIESHQAPITELLAFKIHHLLMDRILKTGYRNVNVYIKNAKHKFPEHSEIEGLMIKFYEDKERVSKMLHPVELAAWIHAEFVAIHPFTDGNGRTTRLLMNYQLLQDGYWPISIPLEQKEYYFKLLDEYAVNGSLKAFVDFVAELEIKELKRLEI